MPQKAQFLLQLAQAAARESRSQQAALPQVAVNVWDTLTGTHATSIQHASSGHKQTLGPARSSAAAASERLASGLSLLNFNKQLGQDGHLHPSQLLAQQAGPSSHWAQHPHQLLGSSMAADTAALYDNSSGQQLLMHSQGLPTSVLSGAAAGFAGQMRNLPRPAAAGISSLGSGSSGSFARGASSSPLLTARKPRFNNSISLNKQIMNTNSMRELHTIVRSKGPSFDFFNISSAIARVPKLVGPTGGVQNDATAKSLVDDLASLMATHINTFDARGLANSAWAFGKLKYAPNQKLPALIAAAAIDKMEAFSAQNLSNLLWSFVYLHYRNEQLMNAVAKQVISKVDEFKPQELANVVWAFASMEHYDPQVMDIVGRRALGMVDQFKEQELSNVVWAFAKLHHYDEVLFTHLLAAVAAKLPHFLPQGISNIAWALATAGHRDDGLFEHLLGHCLSDIQAYDIQGLSNLLWSCATLGHKDSVFLSAVLQECSCRIERMSSQNLSNALWACATLGHADTHMLGSWADAVMHKLDMFEPQGLSNTAWAFAKLGFSSPVLFEAMADASLGKLDMFTAQGLSNTAWAYATVGHYHPALVQQLSDQVGKLASSFNAQNCSVSAWAFATLRHYHPDLFDVLLEQLAQQLGDVEPQNIANSLWAFARMGHPLGRHTEALVATAKRLLPQMNQQELCNTAWALGVLGQLDVHTWEQFCACLASVQGLTPEGVHQAFHAQLMLQSYLARCAGVPLSSLPPEQLPTLPEPLHSHARHMWLTSAVDVHVSKLQADVSSALLLAGIPNSMEWLTDDGLFSIDIAFQVDGQPVAVEVDGSHHYTNSVPHIPLSEVLVRRRLLQDRGWKVVNVGYLDWEALPDDPHTKAAALLQLVAAELGPRSSWQQVAAPAGEPGSVFGVQPTPAHSHYGSNLSCNDSSSWQGGLYQQDSSVAAAAAAAIATAVGGESHNGVVTYTQQQGRYAEGVSSFDNGGIALGVPALGMLPTGFGSGSWPSGLGSYGGFEAVTAWGTNSSSGNNLWGMRGASDTVSHASMLQQLQQQQQRMWQAFATAAATPQQSVSPEHLAVGGPTSAGPTFCSTRTSSNGGVIDAAAAVAGVESAVVQRSLPPSPGSSGPSKASSCCEEGVEEGAAAAQQLLQRHNSTSSGSSSSGQGFRMPAFTWADPLTASIWGPAAVAGSEA